MEQMKECLLAKMDAKEAEIRTDQEKIRKKPNKNRC
jgi:hypothetical protein